MAYHANMSSEDDAELETLSDLLEGRWHVTRSPRGLLDAAREPGRGYHVIGTDGHDLLDQVARVERDGSLVR